MDKKSETLATYNTSASQMADKFRNLGCRIDDIERGFSYLTKQNPSVLEIGCGDGRDAKEILKHTENYLGIDISASMIAIASEYVPKARFEVSDIEEYPFPNKDIDIIFAFASLLHSDKESVKQILERAYHALSDKGIFYISLKYDTYQEKTITDQFGTRTYFFYTPEDIKELAVGLYEVIFEESQEFQNQKWLMIVLQKQQEEASLT